MNYAVGRYVAIIANDKVLFRSEHDFPLRRWIFGNVRIRLVQSPAIHHHAARLDGDSFARQTNHPFEQHEPASIQLDSDHIASFRSVPAESQAVNQIDTA